MLLPDTTRPMVLPCRADDLADDEEYRHRATPHPGRHAHAIIDGVQEISRLGLVDAAIAEIRAHPASRPYSRWAELPMNGGAPRRLRGGGLPHYRQEAVPAATVPQRSARTNSRAVLRSPGSLSPETITIKARLAARR
jgi:hypothetical protein